MFLVALLIGTFVTFFPQTRAYAITYPKPSWWTYSDSSHQHCDSGHFGNTYTLLTTWNGLEVCGPVGSNTSVTFPNGVSEGEWQCVELVARYLLIVYGAPALSNTNGDQVVANYASTYSSLFTSVTNDGNTHTFPKAGDVISYSDVHTAIITEVTVTDPTNGNATLTLIEQNAVSSGTTTQKVIAWKIKGDKDDPTASGTDTVSAWLTPKQSWSDYGPGGTTYDSIYSMSATSTSNVWAAGYEQPSGLSKQPVTYYHDSTQWHKYSPPSQGIYNVHMLYGIAASSSTDAWTVGKYAPSSYQTLAYHWNGFAWSLVTSDNPSTSSDELLSVAVDSSGNAYAVGDYYNNMPLIEKWNGTKFAQQTISLPSNATHASLNGVTFSSSSNGWAVGNAYSTSFGGWTYIIYHYDGTSWTSTLGSINAGLNSVTIVSSSEAWAIGSKGSSGTPYILHYTSANGWQEDSSFSSYYPSNVTLNSISADAVSNVWIAGSWNNGSQRFPFTLHYNGYYWVEIDPPLTSGSVILQGIVVNSGNAWAGGFNSNYAGTQSPTPTVNQYS